MKRAIIIGVVTAAALTYVRGSFADSPWVVLVFGGAGFCGSLLLSWLFRRDSLQAFERTWDSVPLAPWLRNILALALSVSLLYWSGPIIISGGYAGWLVWLMFCIAAPVAVCLLASRWTVPFGLLTATCIEVSVILENARLALERNDTRFWQDLWSKDLGLWLTTWAVAAGLSLIASVPIHLGRRRAKPGSFCMSNDPAHGTSP